MIEKKDYLPDYIYALLNSSYISPWGLFCLIIWAEQNEDLAEEISNQYKLDTNTTDEQINNIEMLYGEGAIELIVALLNHNNMSEEAKYWLIVNILKSNFESSIAKELINSLQPIYFPNYKHPN